MKPLRFPAALAAALAAGVLPAGCGEEEAPSGAATLRVYVSLPLTGPAAEDGRDAADGAVLALDDADGEAGGYAVEAEILNAADGERGWTPAHAGANARRAIRDSTAIAYLGDFESGATRASLPITNGARMLQVSPASGAGDLVASVPGGDDVPDVQHSGERSFGRVIPSDDAQARAAAAWVRDLGVDRVAAESDRSSFGKSMVSAFEAALQSPQLASSGAELLYFAAEPGVRPRSGNRVMVTDAQLSAGASGALPAGSYATSAALDPSQLPPAGEDFAARFETEYGRAPGRYAAYGYEAMALILDSLDRATDPADRQAVVEAFFDTSSRDSILGPYSITETGETTLGTIGGYEIGRRGAEPVARLEIP